MLALLVLAANQLVDADDDDETPDAPTQLRATPGDSQVSLTWSEPKAAEKFDIDYYIVYQDGDAILHTAGTSAVVDDLTNGRTYSFAVAAHNDEGVGKRTPAVKATPRASATAPGAPPDLRATAGNAQVTLTWTAPSSDGGTVIDHYVVYQDGEDILHYYETSASISGLTNGRSYTFTVAAHNSVGIGPRSNAATATPSAPASQASAPNAPTDLRAQPGDGAVSLSWAEPGGEADIDYYVIYQDGIDVMHVTGTSATVSGLVDGEAYTFGVAAHGPGGTSPSSVLGEVIPTPAAAEEGWDNTALMLGILVPIGVVGTIALVMMNRTRTRRLD